MQSAHSRTQRAQARIIPTIMVVGTDVEAIELMYQHLDRGSVHPQSLIRHGDFCRLLISKRYIEFVASVLQEVIKNYPGSLHITQTLSIAVTTGAASEGREDLSTTIRFHTFLKQNKIEASEQQWHDGGYTLTVSAEYEEAIVGFLSDDIGFKLLPS